MSMYDWQTEEDGPTIDIRLSNTYLVIRAIEEWCIAFILVLAASFPLSWVWSAFLAEATDTELGPLEFIGVLYLLLLFVALKGVLSSTGSRRTAAIVVFIVNTGLALGIAGLAA